MALVKLRHKTLEGLKFGANNEIKFGLAGGFQPGELIIDDQDPMYPLLMELEGPNLDVIPDGPPARYMSPIEPGREFASKQGLIAHVTAAAKKGDELAKGWLLRIKNKPDGLAVTPELDDEAIAAALSAVISDPSAVAAPDASAVAAADGSADPDETAPGVSAGVHRSRDGVVMQDPVSPPVRPAFGG